MSSGSSVPKDSSEANKDPDLMAAYQAIFEEMIDDISFDICLKAHRALKLGYFHTDEYLIKDAKFVLPEQYGSLKPDKSSYQPSKVVCVICKRVIGAQKFAPHLNTHEEFQDDGRSGSYYSERKSKSDRLPKRTESFEKAPPPKPVPFEKMTLEQKKALLEVKCCVPSKKTGQNCKRSLNCPVHTDEERRNLRLPYEESADALASVKE